MYGVDLGQIVIAQRPKANHPNGKQIGQIGIMGIGLVPDLPQLLGGVVVLLGLSYGGYPGIRQQQVVLLLLVVDCFAVDVAMRVLVVLEQGHCLHQAEQSPVDGLLAEGPGKVAGVLVPQQGVAEGLGVAGIEEQVALVQDVAVALLLLDDVVV